MDNESRYNSRFAFSGLPLFGVFRLGIKYPLDIFIFQDSILSQRSIFVKFEYQWWEVRDFHIHDFVVWQLFDMFYKARIELPCAPTNTFLPSLRAGAILSSQNGRARSKSLSSFQHLNHWIVKWSVTTVSVVLSVHHHGPLQEAIHRMNDARCELVHHQIVQQLLLCFTSQTTVVTFVQAPWFSTGTHNWSEASSARFVVLIARFNTEVYAWSNSIPASLINLPASIACCVPFQTNQHQPNQWKG